MRAAISGRTYHGCPIYTPNDWFTTNLLSGSSGYVSTTVDPHSADIIKNLVAANGPIDFSADAYPTLAVVNIATERNVVAQPIVRGLEYGFANDPFNDDPRPARMPITAGTFPQVGSTECRVAHGDCHVIVLDVTKCVDYETYGSDVVSWNGSAYVAQGGGVENLNHPYVIEPFTVSAADIPQFGTTDFGEELAYQQPSCQPNCAIPHIESVLLPQAGVSVGGYVSPADYGIKCTSYCTNKLPYGARLRLRVTYVCPSASAYPQANLLCNQAKQYGWIFDDTVDSNRGAGGIKMGLSADGSNPWNEDDYSEFLRNVHITDFDVMTLGPIQ